MKTWHVAALALTLALAVSACDGGGLPASPSSSVLTEALEATLARAIQDEYHAEIIYQGVIDDFGAVQPFSNILTAEQRHSAAIAGLYASRGLTPPASRWTVDAVPHFATVQSACAAGAAAERDNIALYDDLLRTDLPADLRQVFENNRRASAANHLPAFEQCS